MDGPINGQTNQWTDGLIELDSKTIFVMIIHKKFDSVCIVNKTNVK